MANFGAKPESSHMVKASSKSSEDFYPAEAGAPTLPYGQCIGNKSSNLKKKVYHNFANNK